MRRLRVCGDLLGLGLMCGVAAGTTTFPLKMTGAQEVPGRGDPDGLVAGTFTIHPTTNTIAWSMTHSGLALPLTELNIHSGAVGEAGGLVISLGTETSGGEGTLIGSTTVSDAIIAMLLAAPSEYYLNVHNTAFPNGAVRGQIPAVFQLTMTGAQVVPGPGDPDGLATGLLALNTGTNSISWHINYSQLAIPLTGFRIHAGQLSGSGDMVISLGSETTGGPGTIIGSTPASAAQISAIIGDPAGHYTTITNAAFSAGAVRGQIRRVGDFDADGDIDGLDLVVLLSSWTGPATYAPCPPALPPDLSGDCRINGMDLAMLLGQWVG